MSPKVSLHTVVLPNLVHTSLKSPKIALKEVLNLTKNSKIQNFFQCDRKKF